MKQKRNEFELSTDLKTEAFFRGKVIKLTGYTLRGRGGSEPRCVAYLRREEFEALVAWMGFIANVGNEHSSNLVLDNNEFDFGLGWAGGKTFADMTQDILKKISFGVASQYQRVGLNFLMNERDGLLLTNCGEFRDSFYLIRVIKSRPEDFSYLSYSELTQHTAYKSLSEASVTIADRLSAIIGMSTAPDTGYEVGLRNGIGELKLLENANRDTLKTVVEDLIR
jgi:hypothetical protein